MGLAWAQKMRRRRKLVLAVVSRFSDNRSILLLYLQTRADVQTTLTWRPRYKVVTA